MNFNPAILRSNLMHAKIMEWTNDDALELIEQYRSHTELWNRADPKYKDKLCRFRAWSEIAERFGCSKAEVERKMNVLLTQYRREKHKMLVKLYQGIQPNPSKWYAFKRFDFMEAGGGSEGPLVVKLDPPLLECCSNKPYMKVESREWHANPSIQYNVQDDKGWVV
uniref:MADF domain-containing protein n=1 Tax=Glossina palpalis gambiensis TaxID=67801 RepID=A0A1B0BR90_9MUSC